MHQGGCCSRDPAEPGVQNTGEGLGDTALGVGQERGDRPLRRGRGAVERARTARADSKLPLRESGEKKKKAELTARSHTCAPRGGMDSGTERPGHPQHRGYPRDQPSPRPAKNRRPPRVTSPPEPARRGRAEGHGSCHRYRLQPHQRAAARGCAAPEPPQLSPQVPNPSPALDPSAAVNRGEQPGWVLHQP